jgi:hypothetical protein
MLKTRASVACIANRKSNTGMSIASWFIAEFVESLDALAVRTAYDRVSRVEGIRST